ncbi:MAG: helix-turn-helix domain-containing protein [Bacillales bacterium]|nr:helix-turn-helix domain-containing protein [Bacillales bacterium]
MLAFSQWYLDTTFKNIVHVFPPKDLNTVYPSLHEADILKTIDLISSRLNKENNLKALRERSGLSQSELSLLSRVNLKSIKSYEQGENDIRKAQVSALLALSRVLSCSIEELIKKGLFN